MVEAESSLPTETILGALFLAWGAFLLVIFALDLVMGGYLALVFPAIRLWWLGSLALSAGGAWIAFELAGTEGFDVSREAILGPERSDLRPPDSTAGKG